MTNTEYTSVFSSGRVETWVPPDGKEPRSVRLDMFALSDAFMDNLHFEPGEGRGWGLDGKRPFGNSNYLHDVLDIIGVDPGEVLEKHLDEYEEYAQQLYWYLGPFISREWAMSTC